MFGRTPQILNPGPIQGEPPDVSIAQTLYKAVGRLLDEARFDPETSRLDYGSLSGSEAYRSYVALSGGLRLFDPRRLDSRGERLAFWINLYNSLIIHGIIALGVRQSVQEVSGFFGRVAYNVGGWVFSADDIEHGVLRGNARHPYGLRRPFRPWDGRRALVVHPAEPRVHFALVCGSSSCPAIGAYSPQSIDSQLTFAAQAFINDPSRVAVEPQAGLVRLSQIFRWYQRDFGGSPEAVLRYLLDYLDPSEAKDWLEQNVSRASVSYIPYDWGLNA